jgi:hypothetical protein
MKLEKLLSQRNTLLQEVHLANLGFAYAKLAEFHTRIQRAALRGLVTLRHPQPEAEQYWATLTLVEGNQSVIEEHFTDEDVLDFADVLAYLTNQRELSLTFRIEDLAVTFLTPLRRELERIGLQIDDELPLERPDEQSSAGAGLPHNDEQD